MTYDHPYRPAKLTDLTVKEIFYEVSSELNHVMSDAVYVQLEKTVKEWLEREGTVTGRLSGDTITIFLDGPSQGYGLAEFEISLTELCHAQADNIDMYQGEPRSAVSAMLRKLADEIDKEK